MSQSAAREWRLLRRPTGRLPGRRWWLVMGWWRNSVASGEQIAKLPVSAGLVPGEQDGVRVPGACRHAVAVAGLGQAARVAEGGEVDVAVAEEVRL